MHTAERDDKLSRDLGRVLSCMAEAFGWGPNYTWRMGASSSSALCQCYPMQADTGDRPQYG